MCVCVCTRRVFMSDLILVKFLWFFGRLVGAEGSFFSLFFDLYLISDSKRWDFVDVFSIELKEDAQDYSNGSFARAKNDFFLSFVSLATNKKTTTQRSIIQQQKMKTKWLCFLTYQITCQDKWFKYACGCDF